MEKKNFGEIVKLFIYSTKCVIKYFRGVFICNAIMSVFGHLVTFFSNAYMIRYVVNGIQTGKSIIELLTYAFVMICLNIIYELARKYLINIWFPIADKHGEVCFRKMLYQKSVEADFINYEIPKSYALFDRVLSNTKNSLDLTLGLLIGWIGTITSISLSSWLIFTIDPILIVFAIVPVFFNLYYGKLIQKKHTYDSHIREINRKKDYARRVFYLKDYAKELRLSNIWHVIQHQFTDATKEYASTVKNEGQKVALGYYIINNLGLNIPIYAAQIYCLYHTLVTHTIYVGDCLVVLTSLATIVNPIKGIANWYASMNDIALKMADFQLFLKTQPQNYIIDEREVKWGDIEFSNVSFAYEGSTEKTLKHINVKIHAGETVVIVGKNGAGKTTLVKLLMRLYNLSDGKILLDNYDINEYALHSYRDAIGVVMQDYKPLALSVAENVLGRPCKGEEDEQLVIDALKKVGLLQKIQSATNGIHTVLTKEFSKYGLVLSGGELQKLAIASIYAKNCDIVIMDEPSSALDPLAEREMYETMRTVCKNKTIIFISHRLSTAVDADKIILMDKGMVKEFGTHMELMKKNGLYAEMFKVQALGYTESIEREVCNDE